MRPDLHIVPPVDYPLSKAIIHHRLDRKPAPRRVANDVEPVLETWGGFFGIAVCIVAAVFMGVCLAVQM